MKSEKIQTEMFPEEEILEGALVKKKESDRLQCVEARGEYTAERLKKLRPREYNAIVAMLGAGMQSSQIAKIMNVHLYTVLAVSDMEPEVVAKAKQRFEAMAMTNSILAQEKVREMMLLNRIENKKDCSPDAIYKMALSGGILADKAIAVGGGATQKIVVEVNNKFEGSWEEYAAKNLKPKTIEAEVIDVKDVDAD